MTTYRDKEQEKKINKAYKKIFEAEKKKNDKEQIVDNWTKGVNEAYKKVLNKKEE